MTETTASSSTINSKVPTTHKISITYIVQGRIGKPFVSLHNVEAMEQYQVVELVEVK